MFSTEESERQISHQGSVKHFASHVRARTISFSLLMDVEEALEWPVQVASLIYFLLPKPD